MLTSGQLFMGLLNNFWKMDKCGNYKAQEGPKQPT
jgi:hypothetical protein